jgi:hypothetical protein
MDYYHSRCVSTKNPPTANGYYSIANLGVLFVFAPEIHLLDRSAAREFLFGYVLRTRADELELVATGLENRAGPVFAPRHLQPVLPRDLLARGPADRGSIAFPRAGKVPPGQNALVTLPLVPYAKHGLAERPL